MKIPVLPERIFFVLLIIFIALNITLVINSLKIKKFYHSCRQELTSAVESIDINEHILINRELNTIKNIGLQINTKQMVSDEKGSKRSIVGLLNDSPKIIFRYSELNCQLCIEDEIQILKKYIDAIGFDNILFFSTYNTTRDLFLFKRMNQLQDFEIYNLKEEKLNIPVDSLNIPYVFVVDSFGNVFMLHIPERTKPEYSEQFYKVVISRLASK